MIEGLRMEQRKSIEAFADGLTDLVRGVDSLPAEAAALNIADLLILFGNANTDNKWSG